MAFPVIKSSPAPVGNGSGTTITSGNLTVANGDLILVFGHSNSTDLSCSDSQGNTYTKQQVADPFGGNAEAIFTALASAASSTLTVTVTEAGTVSQAYNMLAVYIIDGTTIPASFFDTSGIGNDGGASSTTPSSGNTQANCAGGDELVVGFTSSGTGGVSGSYTAGATYTLDNTVFNSPGSGARIGDEHKTQTGVTTMVSATFTDTVSDVHISAVAVIKGVAAAAATLPPNPRAVRRTTIAVSRSRVQQAIAQPIALPPRVQPIRRLALRPSRASVSQFPWAQAVAPSAPAWTDTTHRRFRYWTYVRPGTRRPDLGWLIGKAAVAKPVVITDRTSERSGLMKQLMIWQLTGDLRFSPLSGLLAG